MKATCHLSILIQLKLTELKNSFRRLRTRSPLEVLTLVVFLLGAGFGLFILFSKSFQFFQGQKPFGPILIDECFYLLNFTLFVMLLISSGVSAYSSLFKSPEVPFLLTQNIRWNDIYFIKLLETLWFSAWPILFITIPFTIAFGITRSVSLGPFPFLCFVFYLPFVLLAAMIGNLGAVFSVWLLPTKARRKAAILALVGVIIYFFARTQPEIIREQGSLSGILSGYLPHVAFAKFPLLPSYWATRGILAFSQIGKQTGDLWEQGVFYFLVLFSNTLFFLIPSMGVGNRMFAATFLRAQDCGEIPVKRKNRFVQPPVRWFDHLPWPSRPAMAFLEKDIKTFMRDASEWSQLIIFFGLLLVYFLNLKNFEFHVLKDMWKNIIFVLNTVGTYVVLSSFSMRFVFPMLSLEGSRAWIIAMAPVSFASLLLEKFLLGTVVSAVLTLPLVYLSGCMLEIGMRKVFFTTCLGFFVCVALTGLSVGFGARFPDFKSNNPSQIISGLGGSLLLVTHLIYLLGLGVFLLAVQHQSALTFAMISAASLLVGMLPLKLGMSHLKKLEF